MKKEKLSLLMDGESVDFEFIDELGNSDSLKQDWYRYHLIRDILRGDLKGQDISFDISDKIAKAIDAEPIPFARVEQLLDQPHPTQLENSSFGSKRFKKVSTYVSQIAIAACVAVVAIIGVQEYNAGTYVTQPGLTQTQPTFNTVPVNVSVAPVGYHPSAKIANNDPDYHVSEQQQQQLQDIQDMLNNYELHRRLVFEQK